MDTVSKARGPHRRLWSRAVHSNPVPAPSAVGLHAGHRGPRKSGKSHTVRGAAGKGQSLRMEREHFPAPQPIAQQHRSGNPALHSARG